MPSFPISFLALAIFCAGLLSLVILFFVVDRVFEIDPQNLAKPMQAPLAEEKGRESEGNCQDRLGLDRG